MATVQKEAESFTESAEGAEFTQQSGDHAGSRPSGQLSYAAVEQCDSYTCWTFPKPQLEFR